jgi:plasmid stability protein
MKAVHLRMPDDVHAALKARAEAAGRSLNAELLQALMAWLKRLR